MIDEIMCKPSLRAFSRPTLFLFGKNILLLQLVQDHETLGFPALSCEQRLASFLSLFPFSLHTGRRLHVLSAAVYEAIERF